MNDESLPLVNRPFVAKINGQQPASFVQGTFLIGADLRTYQCPITEATTEAVVAAWQSLLLEVSKAKEV